MPHVFPDWVAELTDPRRAGNLEELADRLVPLAERAVDVSRRLQEQLTEVNAPFEPGRPRALVDGLQRRAEEAFAEVNGEIESTTRARMERLLTRVGARDAAALRAALAPELSAQRRLVAERLGTRTGEAVQEAAKLLLDRTGLLARSVAGLVTGTLPAAQEGLALAGRISALAGKVRAEGRGPVPAELRAHAAALASDADATLARLELEWSVVGAHAAAVRSAMRAAEEAAVSAVTSALAEAVAELAPAHIRVLADLEHRALARCDAVDSAAKSATTGDLPESIL
ncbi:hypothetical protein LO762_02780 [Actinocorallia sp. API 0066]|uniref:hypothetical protein n=1 Tax=Actinocorallia sp. API 0066 TaxID=2896846 RepID=UPI001E4962B8|nr:hypothetical protein [Actinocorallia sp. API 0066]MCD0448126.1 hypothetical protein [Actinocorallia sp. API 0066]